MNNVQDLHIKELDSSLIAPSMFNYGNPDQGGSKTVIIGKHINRRLAMIFHMLFNFVGVGLGVYLSIYIGIPSNHSSDLIYFEARGSDKETLVVERNYMEIGDYEMIEIYLTNISKHFME